MLFRIAEEYGDTFDVHFPGGIEASIVQMREMTYGRREMARETDGTVE